MLVLLASAHGSSSAHKHTHTHTQTNAEHPWLCKSLPGSKSLQTSSSEIPPPGFLHPIANKFSRANAQPELVSKTPRVGLGVQHLAKIQRRRHRPAAALRVAGTKKIGAATAGVSACTRQAQLRLRSGLRTFSRGETRYDRVQLGAAGSSMRLRY